MRLLSVRPQMPSIHPQADRSSGQAAAANVPDVWSALMAAAQQGHGAAYRRLLNEVSSWLRSYFRRRLPPSNVDDAVQETLLAIHRRRHTFDPAYPFGPWLAGIAKRKWVDQLRDLSRCATEDLSEDIAVGDHETAVMSATVLDGLLRQLRPAQAELITLVKVHGFSVEDASRQTGLSPSAVKMNIHRGLARLAALIEHANDLD